MRSSRRHRVQGQADAQKRLRTARSPQVKGVHPSDLGLQSRRKQFIAQSRGACRHQHSLSVTASPDPGTRLGKVSENNVTARQNPRLLYLPNRRWPAKLTGYFQNGSSAPDTSNNLRVTAMFQRANCGRNSSIAVFPSPGARFGSCHFFFFFFLGFI